MSPVDNLITPATCWVFDILEALSPWPQHPTLENYAMIFDDPDWHAGSRQRKLANEKPQDETVDCDTLIKNWPSTPPQKA